MRYNEEPRGPRGLAAEVSRNFGIIYFRCHPPFTLSLTHQAVRGLQFVSEHPSATVQAVAEHIGCAQNTASEIVRRLVEKELIRKQRKAADGREVELRLTEQGTAALVEQTELDHARLARCLARMSASEREQVRSAFQLLREHLEGQR